jgi:hypothetical protein
MNATISSQIGSAQSNSHPRSREPRLPSRIAPFDLGNDKDQIIRALELNRQLLIASQQEPLVDEPAVRDKIDQLLGRLLLHG